MSFIPDIIHIPCSFYAYISLFTQTTTTVGVNKLIYFFHTTTNHTIQRVHKFDYSAHWLTAQKMLDVSPVIAKCMNLTYFLIIQIQDNNTTCIIFPVLLHGL